MVESDPFLLRKIGLQAARDLLAEALLVEQAAEAELSRIELEMWRKRDAASALSEDDSAVEEFARWLPQGRMQLAATQNRLDRANADTIRVRAALAHAEAAVRLEHETFGNPL